MSISSGSLTIVGSGIMSIAHITMQALSAIENATKVFYVVADPVTEAYIRTKNKDCYDLQQYYNNSKPRMDTYVQMSEAMLKEVRAGCKVVGVFYGHPGVFCYPTHRAIAQARQEGYPAKMLPGVSAEDCLYADLGIDPAIPGCHMYEASDFLVMDKPVDKTSHLILWQVGVVGKADFQYKGFNNEHFGVLVDRLEKEYGKDLTLVHYVAASLPFLEPIITPLTLSQLRSPGTVETISAASTFYLPPVVRPTLNKEIASALRIKAADQSNEDAVNAFKTSEKAAIEGMATHQQPEGYLPLRASKPMVEVMFRLALDEQALASYKELPRSFVQAQIGLTYAERIALENGNLSSIMMVMKSLPLTASGAPQAVPLLLLVILPPFVLVPLIALEANKDGRPAGAAAPLIVTITNLLTIFARPGGAQFAQEAALPSVTAPHSPAAAIPPVTAPHSPEASTLVPPTIGSTVPPTVPPNAPPPPEAPSLAVPSAPPPPLK